MGVEWEIQLGDESEYDSLYLQRALGFTLGG